MRLNPSAFLAFGLGLTAVLGAWYGAFGQKGTEAEAKLDPSVRENADRMLAEGMRTFRFDTFGSEEFWGGAVKKLGGVGPGLAPKKALELGLKVDATAVPKPMADLIKAGKANLDDPAVTLALLKANAVVGITGFFNQDGKSLKSVGIQCALCHSTVDDSFAPGIGVRLDGWPNRDLDIGAIVATAPDLSPFVKMLEVDEATVRKVLTSWGPGKFDAELNLDGKAFRPDGKPAATLNPPAFGLAGVNNHTWTGAWGTVTYWNAYVANLEMHGKGNFFDPGLTTQKNIRSRQEPGRVTKEMQRIALPRSSPLCTSINCHCWCRRRRQALTTSLLPGVGKRFSMVRHVAPRATFRRYSRNQAGTCTKLRKSGSMISRPSEDRMIAT
jgi:hypothetical protein